MVRVVNIYYSNTRHFGYDMKRIYDSNMKYLLPCAFNTCSMILFSLAIENLYVNFCLQKKKNATNISFLTLNLYSCSTKCLQHPRFILGGEREKKKDLTFCLI